MLEFCFYIILLAIGGPMTLEELKRRQKKSVHDFRELRRTDPEAAKKTARENLRAAGIITKSGKLAERYR